MDKLSIRDLELKGKRLFIRVDFNVPLEGTKVTDDTRIRETLPTLRLAAEKGARLVIASHLGRPKGRPDSRYSLAPVAAKLGELLGQNVDFSSEPAGADAEARSRALKDGGVLVLENVRFHAGEEKNDEALARQFAALCDGVFVCDAFGSAHRAHASVAGIAQFVEKAAAGLLMEKELEYLSKAITDPERPFVAILGGAKVSDKIEVVENLMKLADVMLIGGGMAYTFLKAKGLEVGKSFVEEDKVDLARQLLERAIDRDFNLVLPEDHVVALEFKSQANTRVVPVAETPGDWLGLDIGPKTVELFRNDILRAKTIVWNGPMGVFENPVFAKGTLAIAKAVAEATQGGATSVVGGGDSVAAVHKSGVAAQISHISTGGGASLEFLAGRKLPGVEALTERK
jgi:phosphoglycerate kinase